MSWTITTIETGMPLEATHNCTQRKMFYGLGLFWIFYSDGINAVFRTSSDGISWSGKITFISGVTLGYMFSIWWDGTYVHYAYAPMTNGGDLMYRRGTPTNDGSISWDTEQTARSIAVGKGVAFPSICVSTLGYPCIVYTYHNNFGGGWSHWNQECYVTKSSTNDGTWVVEFNSKMHNNGKEDDYWRGACVPLSSGNIYCGASREINWWERIYTEGVGLGAITDCGSRYVKRESWSMMSDSDDNIHLAYYTASGQNWKYKKRTDGIGWGSTESLYDSTGEWLGSPLCVITPDLQFIFSFKIKYYRGATGAWGSLLELIPNHGLSCPSLSCCARPYGCYMTIMWVTSTGSLNFAFIQLETSDFDNRTDCENSDLCGHYWWDDECHDEDQPSPDCAEIEEMDSPYGEIEKLEYLYGEIEKI